MKFKFCTFIIFIFFTVNLYPGEKIGISRIYYPENADKIFILDLEDRLLAAISTSEKNEYYALNLKENFETIKAALKSWSNNDIQNIKHDEIIRELNEVNYCIAFEIKTISIKKEKDFYNRDKYYQVFHVDLRILLINCLTKSYIDEDYIEIDLKLTKEKKDAEEEALFVLVKKFKSYLNNISIFKLKIFPENRKALLIWLDKGKNDGIKAQNILIAYEEDEYSIKEHTAAKIIKAEEDRSLAMILYTQGEMDKKLFFSKTPKINLELQIAGGFSLSDKDNPVTASNDYLSVLPFFSIRALIPVGVTFFRPAFHVEFNIFYQDNKVLLPFTVETGCQGEIFIHRFGIDIGFMIGALFAPNLSNNYEIDSVILRPYIHLSVMVITTIELFGEFGYKFFIRGKFYNDWQLDLSGAYFSFGIGINL